MGNRVGENFSLLVPLRAGEEGRKWLITKGVNVASRGLF